MSISYLLVITIKTTLTERAVSKLSIMKIKLGINPK